MISLPLFMVEGELFFYPRGETEVKEQDYNSHFLVPYLLIIPSMIILILFLYWPTIQSFILSLYRTAPFGSRVIYSGLENYQKLYKKFFRGKIKLNPKSVFFIGVKYKNLWVKF